MTKSGAVTISLFKFKITLKGTKGVNIFRVVGNCGHNRNELLSITIMTTGVIS